MKIHVNPWVSWSQVSRGLLRIGGGLQGLRGTKGSGVTKGHGGFGCNEGAWRVRVLRRGTEGSGVTKGHRGFGCNEGARRVRVLRRGTEGSGVTKGHGGFGCYEGARRVRV